MKIFCSFNSSRLLLGFVVHSLEQKQHFHMYRLREQIHRHGSDRTERGSMDPVGRSSAQTKEKNKSFRDVNTFRCSPFSKSNSQSMKLVMAAFALHAT